MVCCPWHRAVLDPGVIYTSTSQKFAGLFATLALALVGNTAAAQPAEPETAERPAADSTAEPSSPEIDVTVAADTQAVAASAEDPNGQPERNAQDDLSETCAERALGVALPSVVRVVSGQNRGSGFFIAADQVITSYALVRAGHGVHIINHEGVRSEAQVSAVDSQRGLVLLSVEGAGQPLTPGDLSMGQRVALLGLRPTWHRDQEPRSLVLEGVVAGLSADRIQLGLPGAPGMDGAPVLNCDGHFVGIAASAHHMHGEASPLLSAVPAAWATDLTSQADRDRGYAGTFTGTMGLAANMTLEPNTRELMGLSLSLGGIVNDWAMLLVRGGYATGGDSPAGDIVRRNYERFRIDPILAGRIYVNFSEWLGFHIEVGGGASFNWSIQSQQRAVLMAPLTIDFQNERFERFSVRPTAFVAILAGSLELSYQGFLELDTASPYLVHTLGLGLRM